MRAAGRTRSAAGFTLIEMAVALTILGWVLGSAVALVSQYADERNRMRELTLGRQVAWNQLMDRYRVAQGWHPESRNSELELEGRERQAGQSWQWRMELEPAMGIGLFRYQVDVSADADARPVSLSMYLQEQGGEP